MEKFYFFEEWESFEADTIHTLPSFTGRDLIKKGICKLYTEEIEQKKDIEDEPETTEDTDESDLA
jgi:hypothetical protein